MSHRPLLPLQPRPAADVVHLHQRRALTAEAELIARRTTDVRIKTLTSIDHSVSNNETAFRAMAAYLLQLQRRNKVTTFGATLGNSEKKMDELEFWERPATLSIGGIDYGITLFSIMRAAGKREKDTTYPQRFLDESVMMLEDGDSKFYVYAERVNGVPQISNPRRWLVLSGPVDAARQETFERFIERHHPDYRIEQTAGPLAAHDTTLRGYAVGSHRQRSDGRFLILAADANAPQPPAANDVAAQPKKIGRVKTRTMAAKAPTKKKTVRKKATARNSAAVKKRTRKATRPKAGARNTPKPKPRR